jgi:hypothetical protein
VADDRQQIIEEFEEAVNMTPKELEGGFKPRSPSR